MDATSAKAVIAKAKKHICFDGLKRRWRESIEAFPKTQIHVRTGLQRVALEWIEENCPNAAYRSAFKD